MTPARERRDDTPQPGLRLWAELSGPEAQEAGRSDPVVIMPVAAIEQHGPHLPLSTDLEIGNGILHAALDRLTPQIRVLLLPTQAFGTSAEHDDFPGTLSLPTGALEDAMVALGASVARAGPRRLVIHNSHGGNRAAIDTAALRLRREYGMLVVKASYFRLPRPASVVLSDREWEHGFHGGAVETALMLHLRPDLVRTDNVRAFPSLGQELEELALIRPEGPAPFAWLAQDLNPEGVVGDALRADAEMGRSLLEHYAGLIGEVIQDAARFPLDRLGDLAR